MWWETCGSPNNCLQVRSVIKQHVDSMVSVQNGCLILLPIKNWGLSYFRLKMAAYMMRNTRKLPLFYISTQPASAQLTYLLSLIMTVLSTYSTTIFITLSIRTDMLFQTFERPYCWCLYAVAGWMPNSVDPDQTPQNAASDQLYTVWHSSSNCVETPTAS